MKTRLKSCMEWLILAVLVLRPSLDVFTDTGLSIGSLHLNPASLISLGLIAAGALWFFALQNKERIELFRSALPLCFLGWLVVLLIWACFPFFKTYMWGTNHLLGIREWLRLLSLFVLFLVILGIAKTEGKKWIFTALLLSFVIPAIVGFYQILFHQGLMVKDVQRIQGTFVHPNPFSFYLVVIIGITFWRWRTIEQKIRWTILIFIQMILLVFTYSFTGAAMFASMAGTLAIGENRRLRIMAMGMAVLFVLLFLGTPIGRHRLKTELKLDQLDEIERTGRETSSLTWRLLNWRFLYREWKNAPFMGYGLNSSKYINPMLKKDTGKGFDPHNDYVRYLAETGGIGFVFFLLFLAGTGYALWKAWQDAPLGEHRHFALMALAIYIAWLAGSGNDNLITATGYQYALWAVFAVAIAGTQASQLNQTTGLKT